MAKIYKFPSKSKVSYKILLYNDNEVDAVLLCLNVFSDQNVFATLDNLSDIDPKLILECLTNAKESWLFSEEFKKLVIHILDNVEVK